MPWKPSRICCLCLVWRQCFQTRYKLSQLNRTEFGSLQKKARRHSISVVQLVFVVLSWLDSNLSSHGCWRQNVSDVNSWILHDGRRSNSVLAAREVTSCYSITTRQIISQNNQRKSWKEKWIIAVLILNFCWSKSKILIAYWVDLWRGNFSIAFDMTPWLKLARDTSKSMYTRLNS